MLNRLLKAAALVVVVGIVAAALLYLVGMRIVLYGGGTPHLQFVSSADRQAAEVARHREAQRAVSTPPPSVTPPLAPALAASAEKAVVAADAPGPASMS